MTFQGFGCEAKKTRISKELSQFKEFQGMKINGGILPLVSVKEKLQLWDVSWIPHIIC